MVAGMSRLMYFAPERRVGMSPGTKGYVSQIGGRERRSGEEEGLKKEIRKE